MSTLEVHQQDWQQRANPKEIQAWLNEALKTELNDLTQRTTVEVISRTLRLTGSERLFDAGFGWGRVAIGVKQLFPGVSLEGIELTPGLTSQAHELFRWHNLLEGVKLEQGDLLKTDLPPARYDAVYSVRVLHYITDKTLALKKLYETLKPGGRIFISIPNRFCPLRWVSYHHPLTSILGIRSEMAKVGFKNFRWGSYGFMFPRLKRFSAASRFFYVERFFQRFPVLRYVGGLAYIVAEK